MWRLSSRKIQSNAIKGFSNDFSYLKSGVRPILQSYYNNNAHFQDLIFIPQTSPVRLFSSSSTDSAVSDVIVDQNDSFNISSLCKGGMVKEAHSVYLLAKEKGRHPSQSSVNFLITCLCDRKKNDADFVHLALKMLDDFSQDKRKYAIKQFSCVVQALCRVSDTESAKALLSKMIHAGPPPGNAVFNTIINGLSKSGDMKGAINIMRMMEDRGLKPDVFAYSVIMSGYTKGGEMEEAAKILAEAKKNHCKLTPVTFHTMIRGYCKLEQFGKAVKLLGEMEKYGVQPNADEYNKLIQSLCLKAADWGMAEKLMEDMTKKGLHLNGITKSLIRAVKELENEAMVTKEASVEA